MTTLRLRHVFAAALSICLLALGATDAHATHFRYGTMHWEVIPTVPPNTPGQTRVKVTTETAWRFSFPWPGGGTPTLGVPLNTGQVVTVQNITTSGVIASANLDVTPSSIVTTEDWFVGSTLLEFQFATTNLPVRIFFAGTARVSNLQDGNNDLNFRVESVMSATPNAASPAASILPIITVGYPSPAATFFIPAGDVENDSMTWSISPTTRSSLTKAAPDGFDNIPPPTLSINPLTGEVTWATNQELSPIAGGHFYAVQFIVTDSKGGETPVDALLRLIQTVPNPPIATINGSENQHVVSVRPNNPVTFTLKGTDTDPGATVTLTSGNLPPGATMTPSLPTVGTSPRTSDFNWTPTLAQAGNTYTVSFAVTDEFGNQDTISAVITVLVNFPPTITCPAVTTAEATGPAGADNVTLDATVNDLDPDALTVRWFVDGVQVETDTVPAGPHPPTGVVVSRTQSYAFLPAPHLIRVDVNDGQAIRECSSTVTVVDTTPPMLHLPASQILEATGPGGAIATWSPDPPEATDIVDGTILATCSATSGSLFPIATTTVNCSATDAHGNVANGSFTIKVQDTTAPVVTVPADITLEATGPGGAVATFVATAVDIVDGNITPICVPASGSTFPITNTTVVCSATDSHGNTGSASFHVIVVDTTRPVVTVPADITREATGPGGAVVTFVATAFDIVDGNITPVCVPASGSTFPLANTTVVCTATDSHGNVGTASFHVIVVDTTPPVISNMPGPISVPGVGGGAFVTWPSPTAFDLVDLVRPVICVPASGTFFPLGVTPVNCSASDTRGNTSTASFTVTVTSSDTKPPKVCLKLNPTVLKPADNKLKKIQVIVTVTDDQDPHPTCAITRVVSTEPVTGPRYGNTSPDWIFSGLNLQLRAERFNKSGRIYTVTVLCSDASGNIGTASATVSVPYNTSNPGCPHPGGGGHHVGDFDDEGNLITEADLSGETQDHNGGGNNSCCTGHDGDRDDDDDHHFVWTNDPQNHNGGGNNPCPNPHGDDDDDHHSTDEGVAKTN